MLSIIQAAGWPIWPLVLCSILALAFIVERFVSLRPTRIHTRDLVDEAIRVSATSVPGPKVIAQLEQYNLLGQILATGWRTLHAKPNCSTEEMRAELEAAGRSAAHQMQRYLPALGSIASGAPLLGLFGTVIGMIEIFGSQAPAGALTGGNPAELAHGISVALYNTAFGLIIAIPTLFFWQYFRARVSGYMIELETATERFARHLETLCGHRGRG